MTRGVHDFVGALLLRDGAILLGKRAPDRDWLAGAWDVFGGHIEPGESEQDALRRELDEELGVVPTCMRYLETIRGDMPDPWRLHVYVVTDWQGTPRNRAPQEHAELRWCTLAEAQQRLGVAHPDFPRLLAMALASSG